MMNRLDLGAPALDPDHVDHFSEWPGVVERLRRYAQWAVLPAIFAPVVLQSLSWSTLLIVAAVTLAILGGLSCWPVPQPRLRAALLLGIVWIALLLGLLVVRDDGGIGLLAVAMDREATLVLAAAALAIGAVVRTWWWTAVVPLVWTVTAFGSLAWRIDRDGATAVTKRWDALVPVQREAGLFSSDERLIQFDSPDILSLAAIAAAPLVLAAAAGCLLGLFLRPRGDNRDWRLLGIVATMAGVGTVYSALFERDGNAGLLIPAAAVAGAWAFRSAWGCALIPLGCLVVHLSRASWQLQEHGLTAYARSMQPCGWIELTTPCYVSDVLTLTTVWPAFVCAPFAALTMLVRWVIRRKRTVVS